MSPKNYKLILPFLFAFFLFHPNRANSTSKAQIALKVAQFATGHPFLALSAAVATTAIVYEGGKEVIKTTAPFALIPFANQYIASYALESDNSGLLDYSLSLGSLFKKIPFLGSFGSPSIPKDALFTAIEGDKVETAKVLIQQAQTAGIDIDAEKGGVRPLGASLQKESTDEISLELLRHNADIRGEGARGAGQNLFFDIVNPQTKQTKKEFLHAALEGPYAEEVLNTAGKDQNNLLHLMAVSPELRKEIGDAEFQPETYNQVNANGYSPFDVAVAKHFQDKEVSPASQVTSYFDGALGKVSTKIKDLFRRVLFDPELGQTDLPSRLLETKTVDPDLADASGAIPLDYAVAGMQSELAKMQHV